MGMSSGTARGTGSRADVSALDHQLTGPTALRMLVGARLRTLREAAGVSRPEAGDAIRASHSKISRLELGRTGFKRRDVADLLTLYGLRDEAERATLLALAEQANEPGWWQEFGDAVSQWFEPYLGLEQAAVLIRSYEVQFVPGLLQTEDYARAVIELNLHDASERDIERRVALRMKRQERLLRSPGPTRLWTIIDEAALRRTIGSRDIMRAQLEQLLRLSELSHVTVTVVPFSAGGHAAAGGPITLLRFAHDQLADVVYLEQLTSALYTNKADDIDHYWHILNRLAIAAETPTESVSTLHRMLKEI